MMSQSDVDHDWRDHDGIGDDDDEHVMTADTSMPMEHSE
jgi:hypothetical protein